MTTNATLDFMFSQLSLTGDTWATTIAGFILVLIIVFGAIAVFGRNGQHIDGFGIILVTFLASVLATALGLFSAIVLIVMLVLTLVFVLIKSLWFNGGSNNG